MKGQTSKRDKFITLSRCARAMFCAGGLRGVGVGLSVDLDLHRIESTDYFLVLSRLRLRDPPRQQLWASVSLRPQPFHIVIMMPGVGTLSNSNAPRCLTHLSSFMTKELPKLYHILAKKSRVPH